MGLHRYARADHHQPARIAAISLWLGGGDACGGVERMALGVILFAVDPGANWLLATVTIILFSWGAITAMLMLVVRRRSRDQSPDCGLYGPPAVAMARPDHECSGT